MLRFLSEPYASNTNQIRVRIHHSHSEGYPPSAEGLEIKEELGLREFLTRIQFTDRNVENELYRVARAMAANDHNQIEMICGKYNDMYIHQLRSGKAVLAQHKMAGISDFKMSFGMAGIAGFADPFDHKQARQMSSQTGMTDYDRQRMMQEMGARAHYPSQGFIDPGPSQAEMLRRKEVEEERKRTDDLFYLTT
jgi:hypothetical protein